MSRRAELTSAGQLALFAEDRQPRRRGYRHEHTPEERAAFERLLAVVYEIRPDWLAPDERLCPGCRKVIRGRARNCGRRWCDAVRPVWGRTVGEIVRAALSAYCDLYGGDGRVLSTVLTCTHKPGWWDTSRCGHPVDGSRCSGPAGCKVRPEIEERERELFPGSLARGEEDGPHRGVAQAAARRLRRQQGASEEAWCSHIGGRGPTARASA